MSSIQTVRSSQEDKGYRIIHNPTFEDIYDSNLKRFMKHSVICLQERDIKHFIEDEEMVVILEGNGAGENRMMNAIDDALSHFNDTAKECNVTDSKKLLVLCDYSKNFPLIIHELGTLDNFFNSVGDKKDCLWGAAEFSDKNDDTMTIRMYLAY